MDIVSGFAPAVAGRHLKPALRSIWTMNPADAWVGSGVFSVDPAERMRTDMGETVRYRAGKIEDRQQFWHHGFFTA
jgi:hypothetical protein